jgi:YggT family protein
MAQGVLRLTSPLIAPLRRLLPPVGRLDTATILVALAIEYLLVVFLLSIRGISVGFVPIAATAFFELVILSLNLLFFIILIRIVLSWVAPGNYSPVTAMLNALAEPVLRPFRRMIPPIGGLDISPIFVIILLQAAIIVLQTYKPIPF